MFNLKNASIHRLLSTAVRMNIIDTGVIIFEEYNK